ncbi:unnamed protein product, partial [Hapterophycus canaliculatus]
GADPFIPGKKEGGYHCRLQGAHGASVPVVSGHGGPEHLELENGQQDEAKGGSGQHGPAGGRACRPLSPLRSARVQLR